MQCTKPFVVVRRFGYYVNVLPNDQERIRDWALENVPLIDTVPGIRNRAAMSVTGLLAPMGYTFGPVTEVGMRQVRPYVRNWERVK